MKRLVILPFLMLMNFGIAQNLSFDTQVLEEESADPIIDALVVIEGTNLSQKTDAQGNFGFSDTVPDGDYLVSVHKEGYESLQFLIEVGSGKRIKVEKLILELTKKERKRRKKAVKKDEKAKEKKIDSIEKALKKREKKLKKLRKDNSVDVDYESGPSEPEVKQPTFSFAQVKYAETLGVPVTELTNANLYDFIDEWMGTPYQMGGANKDGIDCSSFTQRLYTKAYDLYIERTASKQYNSRYTDKFKGQEFLKEGDLLFFKGVGTNSNDIGHVGVYLRNNKFVHSTSRRGLTQSGVKVSDLTDQYWQTRFVAAGRRINEAGVE